MFTMFQHIIKYHCNQMKTTISIYHCGFPESFTLLSDLPYLCISISLSLLLFHCLSFPLSLLLLGLSDIREVKLDEKGSAIVYLH